MNTDTLLCSLLSGLVATLVTLVVTYHLQRREERRAYKMRIFQEILASRTDITQDGVPTGKFQEAMNQVFVAYNDSKEVLDAFEVFRKDTLYRKALTQSENAKIVNDLVALLKAMATELSIDYSFSNDDLFINPIQTVRQKPGQ